MFRLLSLLALMLVATSAQAQFKLSPEIIAVANQQQTQELTLLALPGANTAAAEINIKFNLDQFGWMQVVGAWVSPEIKTNCVLVDGVARATILSSNGGALPTWNALPVCRFRVRPHSKTPRGNYYIWTTGGFYVRTDGSVVPGGSSSMRVIVD